jgi:hypothetical protein
MLNLNIKNMTKIIEKLNRIFVICALLLLFYCTTEETSFKINAPEFSEIIKISGQDYSNFKRSYEVFMGNLTDSQRDLLENYVESVELGVVNGRLAGATCQCAQGQNSCNASGVFGDCCICWWPNTQEGACGVYFGVPSCQIQERQIEGGTRSRETENFVNFYSKRFSEMLIFAKTNSINVKDINFEFEKLNKLAL